VADYERRLEKLEQEAGQFSGTANMILVYLHPGEDKAAKVAEAKLAHGLGEDDSDRILVIQFVAANGNGRKAA
jgi:hypothetical protein